ncbi:MAG: type II toxin-antitoxin system VapC family toxin [Candidatus Magasanikbacteria bacterium]
MSKITDNNPLEILVDADALVALVKTDDSNHPKAVNISKQFQQMSVDFQISPFTIPEAVTVVSYKIGQKEAREALNKFRSKNFFEYDFDRELEKKVDKVFKQQSKKGASYFDCVNLVILEKFKLDGIFSFDSVYSENDYDLAESIVGLNHQ